MSGALLLGAGKPEVERIEQSDPWFEVYRVLPDVYAVREPGHWERVISYLVVGTERALLFDTGTGIGDIRSVIDGLTELEVVVVISHSHPDHVGGNHQFETILAPETEYGRESAKGRSVEDSARFVPERAFSQEPPATFSPETYRIHPWKIARTLVDGEKIDLGGRSLEVLLTPGHSPDSLCLVDRENRFVMTGDTFYLGRIFVASEAGSLDAFAKTATRLAGLAGEVDRVLPAHSATLLQPHFLTQLDEGVRKILKGEAEGEELEDGRTEYRIGRISVVVPAAAR